jgi:hypothetical protein
METDAFKKLAAQPVDCWRLGILPKPDDGQVFSLSSML